MLGYLCAYFRYYHPIEFITSFLNNAANDDDIRSGTAYANRVDIKVTMPKWGLSMGDYFYDASRNIIAKGLTSIKYMSASTAKELYDLSRKREYLSFMDILSALTLESSIDSRQLDILIKIDFFSEYGNQRELLLIAELFNDIFKKGQAKQLRKDKVDGTPLEPVISKYATGVTKSGGVAKNYTLLDIESAMRESEDAVKQMQLEDLSDILKVRNFVDVMGYVGYVSDREEDRPKLYVLGVFPLMRKRDGKQFGYSVTTKSIGSGKESRFTVFNNVYNKDPIAKDDIIYCKGYERDGEYFTLTRYSRLFT